MNKIVANESIRSGLAQGALNDGSQNMQNHDSDTSWGGVGEGGRGGGNLG